MLVRTLTTDQDLRRYGDWLLRHPQGNLWQSLERKKYVEACGKTTRIYTSGKCLPAGQAGTVESGKYEASALVVIDRTAGGYSTWEIPRGPLWTSEEALQDLLKKIVEDAKKERCIQLFFSPQTSLPTGHPFGPEGLRASNGFPLSTSLRHVHCQATRIIDLTASEDDMLAQMHQKGRYNIRLAEKHRVKIEQGSIQDIDAFYALLLETSHRDGFNISQKSHYERFLSDLEGSFLLLAKHEGKTIAGLIGVVWPPPPPSPLPRGVRGNSSIGTYYYGASSYEHRSLMAPYLLQWEAMKFCKAAGCTSYDLLGISPEPAPKDDPWLGISDFKAKFGGTVITYPQEQTIVLRPIIKTMLEWKRKIFS